MDGTKELRTQNPVVTGVLVLEAMTLTHSLLNFLIALGIVPFQKRSNPALV